MVGVWLAGWFVCYLVCRSVEPSGWLAISNLSPTDHWPANHPSIYLTSVLEFLESGVRRLLIFVRLVGCGGVTWPMFASRWPSLERISTSFSRGYTIPPWSLILGLIWERSKRGVRLALPCHVSVHIYSHVAYTTPSASYTPTCDGVKSIFGDTTIDSANTPELESWKGIVCGFESQISLCNCSFYRFSTFEPSLGRDMLPPPPEVHPLPFPHFGKGEF